MVPPQQKKVILIEDETFIADLYSYQLQKAGYIVKVANDGVSGLQLLEQENFDLLLLDIMLPGKNGLEVLREWRSKNPNSQMVVLLLTNLGQDAVIKEGFTLGAQGYLIKASYTPEQIVSEIKNALENKSPGGTTAPANASPNLAPSSAQTPTPQPSPEPQATPAQPTPAEPAAAETPDPTKPQG